MTNSTNYLIAAYVGAALLYGLYLLWLLAQERKLGRRGRDAAR
jgi:hypothetical protein